MYYRILEGEEIVLEGTADEISKKLHVSASSVSTAARKNQRLLWRYTVVPICKASEVKPKTTKHQNKLEWIYRNLYYIGNSFLKEDPNEYVDELKEKGITIKWDVCSDGVGYHLERTYD